MELPYFHIQHYTTYTNKLTTPRNRRAILLEEEQTKRQTLNETHG